jgi:hypothetical protein
LRAAELRTSAVFRVQTQLNFHQLRDRQQFSAGEKRDAESGFERKKTEAR